ncbi:RNA-directed DNA polymerase [Luteimonas sp. SJ-92]|uniref:RNA-directed DNA polymerase n=1 Tax=Luteimonas salinisoli TaxID=2752307 RepID=A0A853JAZ6_9GAMM|nr:RNA-directed DNA polymerase [Luteimonas salinisoli]
MRKIKIDKSNHLRAILTDTLPYEIPFFFTNEPLFSAASNHQLSQGLPTFVKAMLWQSKPTKPFEYKIQKGGGNHRRISLPHPAAQLKFSELYRDFDSFIENVCARSNYSLRCPTRVGSHFFQKQYAADQPNGDNVDQDPASFSSQRQWASSYFYYKRYSHIYKFFSSDEFIRLEQKYSLMLKLDIARCFESIYTHSITWAIRGKDFGKDHKEAFFFESEFDSMMQSSNWGETNGILIGPEVSRIFAEAIMQSIDVRVQRQLDPISDRVAVRRYVDDFFVFGTSRDDLAFVKSVIEDVASQYNLHLNEKKTDTVTRPFTSNLAVARQRVARTLRNALRTAREGLLSEVHSAGFSRGVADHTIAEIRMIAREGNVDYAVLASPALAIIARGLLQIRRRVGDQVSAGTSVTLERVYLASLRISTFLFLMDIRSATTHKLAKIFLECSLLNEMLGKERVAFEGAVLDTVRLALDQARLQGIKGPEIINILVAADAVCEVSKGVTDDFLRSAFGVEGRWRQQTPRMNYFELISTLYFARKKQTFREAREAVCATIEERVLLRGSKLKFYTEETLLFFDFISCPYIKESKRAIFFEKVAKLHGSSATTATHLQQFLRVSSSVFFVAWSGHGHFQAMLERRELQPAYDT